jgi:hypothetical protein
MLTCPSFPDHDFFELGLRDCYSRMHAASPPEVAVLERRIADGLYNVMATCGLLPIIRAQKG